MKNMYNNNYWGIQGYAANYGYAKPKLPNPTNPLSKEDMALLKQKAPGFSLAISQVDALKAICTHRNETGESLQPNSDGTVTCTICGARFTPVNADMDTVEQIFKHVIDCLETMKIMYLDIPDDVAKQYFQMIPFLEKGPQLYKISLDHYSKYNNSSVISNNYNNGGNAFNLFSAIMNPGMAMGMGMPQQAMNMPYGQPGMAQGMVMPQQPVQDVTAGVMNGANPFDVSSPTMDAAKTVTDNKQYNL